MSAPDMPPAAHIVHQVPQRTRLVLPARRGDADFFAQLAAALRPLPGVAEVTVSPRAASLVLRHAGPFPPIAAAAEGAGLFRVASGPPPPSPNPRRQLRPVGRIRMRPLALAAGGLAGLGAVQVARGRGAGSAVEAFWNAYRARGELQMPRLSALLVGIGLVQVARGEVLGSGLSMLMYGLMARRELTRR